MSGIGVYEVRTIANSDGDSSIIGEGNINYNFKYEIGDIVYSAMKTKWIIKYRLFIDGQRMYACSCQEYYSNNKIILEEKLVLTKSNLFI